MKRVFLKTTIIKSITIMVFFIFIALHYSPVYAQPDSVPEPEIIRLESIDKDAFWGSPLIPTSLSFIVPGIGQLYQSDVFSSEPDWLGAGKGIAYLGLLGIGYWQLFSSQDSATTATWATVLISLSVLAPVDAYFSAQLKTVEDEKQQLQQIAQIYENAMRLSSQGKYQKAIEQFKIIPSQTPLFSSAKSHISDLTQKLNQQQQLQQAEEAYQKSYELAKKSQFEEAIQLMGTVSSASGLYDKAQQKIQEWQDIVDEQSAKDLYFGAKDFANEKKINEAIEKLKAIKKGTSYYERAQKMIQEWQK